MKTNKSVDHTSLSSFLKLEIFQRKLVEKIQNIHFLLNNIFLIVSLTVCDIMWKNIVKQDRPQMTIWRMGSACWITKATNAHSEYVIPIAFPLQKWLLEHASMFC